MNNIHISISDFKIDSLSEDEKSRFYKIFQTTEELWQDVTSHINLMYSQKILSSTTPSIHHKGYHTINHTISVVNYCVKLGLKLHHCCPQKYSAIDIMVLIISAMIHDYIQDGDVILVPKKFRIIENKSIITKDVYLPFFKRETGNNEFASANFGVEFMKKTNKKLNSQVFTPYNINSLLNIVQATEPDFGRVSVLEGEQLVEYTTVVQPKLIDPVIITRWIMCVSDLGTVAFNPKKLMDDTYKLIREEIWESNLVKILSGTMNPIKEKLDYTTRCVISSQIVNYINFQTSFAKTQKQRTENYLQTFNEDMKSIFLPFFESENKGVVLGNFEVAIKLASIEIKKVNNIFDNILQDNYDAFIELLKISGYIQTEPQNIINNKKIITNNEEDNRKNST